MASEFLLPLSWLNQDPMYLNLSFVICKMWKELSDSVAPNISQGMMHSRYSLHNELIWIKLKTLRHTHQLRNLQKGISHMIQQVPSAIYPKELKTGIQMNAYPHIFTATLFTIAPKWKQPEFISADEWINKMWDSHTIEYYSAIKRKEILIHATMWMNLENIMLSERSQTQKAKYYMSPF